MRNKNKSYIKVNNCIDCGISITGYRAKRCYKCNFKWKVGKNHPNYLHGKTIKAYYCKCGNKVSLTSGAYGSGMCKKCADEALKRPLKKCKDCSRIL